MHITQAAEKRRSLKTTAGSWATGRMHIAQAADRKLMPELGAICVVEVPKLIRDGEYGVEETNACGKEKPFEELD